MFARCGMGVLESVFMSVGKASLTPLHKERALVSQDPLFPLRPSPTQEKYISHPHQAGGTQGHRWTPLRHGGIDALQPLPNRID